MKLNKLFAFCAAAFVVVLSSCSDDILKTPLSTTQGESDDVSYTSLTFKWDKVPGALQYGYQLFIDEEDPLQTGVTALNNVTFSDLTPDTEYTLKVWAYADVNGTQTTSEPLILKARTLKATLLSTPLLECYTEGRYHNVVWDPVTGATGYIYSLTLGDETVESGETTETSLWFSDLKEGTYTVSVQAVNSEEGYLDSEPATAYLTVERTEIWRAKGTYTSSILDNSWNATLVAYSDNSYSILGWYVVEGYNLDFYIDPYYPDNAFVLTGDYTYDDSSYYYGVPTGRSDLKSVWVYPWYNYCSITGDKDAGAISLSVFANDKYGTDTFSWGAATKAPADDFVGTWNVDLSGQTSITDDWSWESFSYSDYTIEITKVDDNTIRMDALYFGGDTMDVKIDLANKTLTVQPCTVWTYYTLAGTASPTAPVIGTINDDGSIEFNDWTGWYGTTYYLYDAKAKLWR